MTRTYLPYIVIAALILYIAFTAKQCGKDKDTATVTLPAVEGKSDTIYKPVPIPQPYPVYKYEVIGDNGKPKTIEVPNPINQDLLNFYLANQNKRDSLYTDAIGEREYNIPIEDSLLLTNNYIKTQGKVLAFQQTYTIKPRKIEVPVPKSWLRLSAGFEVGNTMQFDKFAVKGNVNVNGLNIGYDTNKNIWLGYNWTLVK